MNCKRARRMMSLLADRQLPSEQRDSLIDHLESCSSCAAEHRQTARLSAMLNGLEVPDPGEAYWRGLSAAVQTPVQQAGSSQRTSAVRSKPLLAGAAAAVIAALGVGIILSTFRGQDVLAATLEAMEGVKTAHIVFGVVGEEAQEQEMEMWFSAEHGIRSEGPGKVMVATSEGTWDYDVHDNTVTVSDPQPRKRRALLNHLSSLATLRQLRDQASGPNVRSTPTVLGGEPVIRIDLVPAPPADVEQLSVWVDQDTKRVVATEMSLAGEGGRGVLKLTTRIEYDIPIEEGLFTLEPPPGAKVVDARLTPSLQKVIDEAVRALDTEPVHAEGRMVVAEAGDDDYVRHFGQFARWEGWLRSGEGYRVEHADGLVRGETVRRDAGGAIRHERWRQSDTSAEINDVSPDSAALIPTQLALANNLHDLQERQLGSRPLDTDPEIRQERKHGKQLARIVTRGELPKPGGASREVTEERKWIYTFDCEARRLIEFEDYVRQGDEWRLLSDTQLDYPEKLPEEIFEFDPPLGAEIYDHRDH